MVRCQLPRFVQALKLQTLRNPSSRFKLPLGTPTRLSSLDRRPTDCRMSPEYRTHCWRPEIHRHPMQLLQVIPRLPPPICGVADYAISLARPLRDLHRCESRFISASPLRVQNAGHVGFPVEFLPRHTPSALREAVLRHPSTSGVLLQYSGYGFAPRGAPVWLVRALSQLKKSGRLPPLHVMFHELWFRGKITNSSFWNWPLQRWGVGKLCSLASTITTNREVFAHQLGSVLQRSQSKVGILSLIHI